MQMITDKQTEPPFGPWEICSSGPPAASGVDGDCRSFGLRPAGREAQTLPAFGPPAGLGRGATRQRASIAPDFI